MMGSCTVCGMEFADEAAKVKHMEDMKNDPAHQNMGGGDTGGDMGGGDTGGTDTSGGAGMGGDMASDGHDHGPDDGHDH